MDHAAGDRAARAADLLARPRPTGESPRRTARGFATTFALAALLCALLASCSQGHPLSVGAPHAPFDTPEVYLAWWAEVEACSHRTADFGRVDWRLVDAGADGTFLYGRVTAAGAWESPHSIYISDGHVWTEPLVKHEMLHDLLQSANHFDQAFFICGLHGIEH